MTHSVNPDCRLCQHNLVSPCDCVTHCVILESRNSPISPVCYRGINSCVIHRGRCDHTVLLHPSNSCSAIASLVLLSQALPLTFRIIVNIHMGISIVTGLDVSLSVCLSLKKGRLPPTETLTLANRGQWQLNPSIQLHLNDNPHIPRWGAQHKTSELKRQSP